MPALELTRDDYTAAHEWLDRAEGREFSTFYHSHSRIMPNNGPVTLMELRYVRRIPDNETEVVTFESDAAIPPTYRKMTCSLWFANLLFRDGVLRFNDSRDDKQGIMSPDQSNLLKLCSGSDKIP